jgi:hypothetical protein
MFVLSVEGVMLFYSQHRLKKLVLVEIWFRGYSYRTLVKSKRGNLDGLTAKRGLR